MTSISLHKLIKAYSKAISAIDKTFEDNYTSREMALSAIRPAFNEHVQAFTDNLSTYFNTKVQPQEENVLYFTMNLGPLTQESQQRAINIESLMDLDPNLFTQIIYEDKETGEMTIGSPVPPDEIEDHADENVLVGLFPHAWPEDWKSKLNNQMEGTPKTYIEAIKEEINKAQPA